MKKQQIQEELNRFNSILKYDLKGVKVISEAPGDEEEFDFEAETEEGGEEPAEGGDNPDFDFGAEEGGEEAFGAEGGVEGEDNSDFDFGAEGGEESFGAEGGEEVEDEFGTASEFSAADELEGADEDVEEIDVTDIVMKSDEAKDMSQQAVSIGQENSEYLKSLTDKLTNLEAQLVKMDTIASKIGKIEQDIKTPEEKLELRSLDSYPFNINLSDYWNDKASEDDNYSISTGVSVKDGDKKEYVLDKEIIDKDYDEMDIKNSFNPS